MEFSRRCRWPWLIAAAVVMAAVMTRTASARAQLHTPIGGSGTDGGFPGGACLNSSTGRDHCPVEFFCVNPDGANGCQTTISAAVSQISGGTVIITVASGTYIDNVSINTSGNPIPISVTPKPLNLTIASSSTASATVIDGNNAGPVFSIGPKAKVQLEGLTIIGGTGGPVQNGTGGGGLVANGSELTVVNCVVNDNQAEFGAGIYADDSDLDIESSVISGNAGQGDGAQGGGIYFASAKAHKLKIVSSKIDANSASFSGGGIFLYGGLPIRSSAKIIGSTISNNTTDNTTSDPGGGAGLDLVFAKLIVLNSTISGNNAAGVTDTGGAMRTALSDVSLDNVTVANNSAGETAGGIDANTLAGVIGGGRIEQKFIISNTIIADNNAPVAPDCLSGLPQKPIVSAGYNLIGDFSDCALTGQTNDNLEGDPLLGPLQNNGGATDTQALLAGSPALGAGNPKKPNENGRGGRCLATDQIGTPRPQGDCDIGAWQLPQ
jgi:hypothetical protein